MLTQLAFNTAPEDSLLIDNSKSYFTNVGYVRSSNFQMELRDVEPQNSANLGSTATFIVPKAADLLGKLDLMVHLNRVEPGDPSTGWLASLPDDTYVGWVESLGYAMIESVDFQVNMHSIEKLTGEDLNIMNELMRGESTRHGFRQILKTGRPLVSGEIVNGRIQYVYDEDPSWDSHDRLIAYKDKYGQTHIKDGKRMCIPLSLMFTSHPSKYLPLAAIAQCNDIRIVVKFRPWQELVMVHKAPELQYGTWKVNSGPASNPSVSGLTFVNGSAFQVTSVKGEPQKGACTLRCEYIHLTGPEATALMGKEHVRILKKWDQNRISMLKDVTHSALGTHSQFDMDLNFLHPVQMLVITIRRLSEFGSSLDSSAKISNSYDANSTETSLMNQGARSKNYFAYQGGGVDPNMENIDQTIKETLAAGNAAKVKKGTAASGTQGQDNYTAAVPAGLVVTLANDAVPFQAGQTVLIRAKTLPSAGLAHDTEYEIDSASTPSSGTQKLTFTNVTFTGSESGDNSPADQDVDVDVFQKSGAGLVPRLDVTNFKLTINGHSRHLDGKGLDKDYLVERMMPAMHSNQSEFFSHLKKSSGHSVSEHGHASMNDLTMFQQYKDRKDIFVYPFAMNPQSENPSGHINFSKVSHAKLQIDYVGYGPAVTDRYEVNVVGVHYNWAAIKDGRMLVTFA